MAAFMSQNNVAGCSLALVYPDQAQNKFQTHLLNYGRPAKGSKTAVDSTTEYEIGSLTKLFTADLLALFVRDGLMKLDDPLQKYLPASVHVPAFNGRAITLRDLATHTSGLPRKTGNVPQVRIVNGVPAWGYSTAAELFQFLNAYSLTRAPGSQWEYSNLAFALLGIADEKAGNATYDSLVTNRLAEPLSLHDTRIVLSAAQKARLAQGYSDTGDAAPPIAISGESLSAGALRSTIQDLAAYLVANIDPGATKLDSVLSLTEQKQAKGSSANGAAGLGWNISAPGTPQEQLTKDGSTAGFSSYIAFAKASRTGFAVVCNGHNVSKIVSPQLHKLLGQAAVPIDDSE